MRHFVGEYNITFGKKGLIYFPTFNRHVQYLRIEYAVIKESKNKYNINRNVWLNAHISNCTFLFSVPVHSNCISFS